LQAEVKSCRIKLSVVDDHQILEDQMLEDFRAGWIALARLDCVVSSSFVQISEVTEGATFLLFFPGVSRTVASRPRLVREILLMYCWYLP
jgi:hypothetical protein